MALATSLPAAIPAGTGPTRYIDGANGNDTWDGTTETFTGGTTGPWKTADKAYTDGVANPTSGRTYQFADGTYRTVQRRVIAATLTGNGPMTFKAKNPGQVVFQHLYCRLTSGITLTGGATTLNVDDTTGFAASGTLRLWTGLGVAITATYTAKTATTFTISSSGIGTLPNGQAVIPMVNGSTANQVLCLQNSAYVRHVGINFDGQYMRSAGDNNAIVFFAGTSHHLLLQQAEVYKGHDHGIFADTTTTDCQVVRCKFRDGGSPCAYPMASSKTAAGSALGAGTYTYAAHGIFESGSVGTDDGSGNSLQTTQTVVNGDKVTVTWPGIDSLHADRNVGVRVYRAAAGSIGNGTSCNYYDLPSNSTSFEDTGQAPTGTVTYATTFSNTDHAIYMLGGTVANPHLICNNIIHDWDFGHTVQLYQKAAGTIVTNNTITFEPYSNGATGRHAAAIVIGSDTGVGGETVDNCVIVNNIIHATNQGVYGYAALGLVKSLNMVGGITLPNDFVTTFTVDLNNVTSMAASGQVAIGRTDRTAIATISYTSIVGSQLQGCKVLTGPGLSFSNSEQVRCSPATLSGGGNRCDHNLIYNPTFTHIRNDPVSSTTVPIVDFHSNGGNITGQDPLFVNASQRNFRLQAGSPAINAGVDTYTPLDDYEGNARVNPDLGALTYSQPGGTSPRHPLNLDGHAW